MAKKILAAANNKEQKYFMEEEFKFLPDTIKEDLKRICVYMAEKLNCTFLVGFDDNGDVYFEFRAMELWYVLFCTKEGAPAKEELMRRAAAEGKTL